MPDSNGAQQEVERELVAGSARAYVDRVRPFLLGRIRAGGLDLQGLTAGGTTPFAARQLVTPPNLTALAREVGLLETVNSPRDNADKFRVPELYRKALNMTRRGQA